MVSARFLYLQAQSVQKNDRPKAVIFYGILTW